MWICLNDAFLSIVNKAESPDDLLVRARRAGDIERYFPDAKVKTAAGSDYLYRAEIPRETVARVVSQCIVGISYPNFKNSVTDNRLHSAYGRVWSTMLGLQSR